MEEAISYLSSENKEINEIVKEKIFEALEENSEILASQLSGNNQINMDINSLAGLLSERNEHLKKIFQENPDALLNFLMSNMQEGGEEDFDG